MGRFSVALKIRGDTDGGTAQAESQCRPARIEPIRPIFAPDCQGALAGMGVKRDKEEKVMCHAAAGTDTRILKKQVCPSRDEQDEREHEWPGEPTKSLPASYPGCKMPFILSLVRLRPSFLCAAGRSEARWDTDGRRGASIMKVSRQTASTSNKNLDVYP